MCLSVSKGQVTRERTKKKKDVKCLIVLRVPFQITNTVPASCDNIRWCNSIWPMSRGEISLFIYCIFKIHFQYLPLWPRSEASGVWWWVNKNH